MVGSDLAQLDVEALLSKCHENNVGAPPGKFVSQLIQKDIQLWLQNQGDRVWPKTICAIAKKVPKKVKCVPQVGAAVVVSREEVEALLAVNGDEIDDDLINAAVNDADYGEGDDDDDDDDD